MVDKFIYDVSLNNAYETYLIVNGLQITTWNSSILVFVG